MVSGYIRQIIYIATIGYIPTKESLLYSAQGILDTLDMSHTMNRILRRRIWNVKQIVLAMKMANAHGLQIMKLVKARLNKINILRMYKSALRIRSKSTMNNTNAVNHPSHYTEGRKYEPIDVITDWGLNFSLGNTIKYISRAGRKDDIVQDLKKAMFYLEYEINRLEELRKKEIAPSTPVKPEKEKEKYITRVGVKK